ncbi:MAG: hypothetical protein RIT45_2505, partial [Pseudomonadota bacterium]
ARQREGRFAITLPPKAAISRFAMKISGSWMEGEVVEKQRARQVYEDFLHRRQDPAILEQDAGNTFRARVFPIPPSGDKEIVVSFSQERADPKEPLRLALRGLGKLGELGLHGFVRDGERDKDAPRVHAAHIVRKDFTPTVDWLLYPDRVDESTEALRNANLTVTRVQVRGKEREQGFGKVVVLVDTSASQAPAWEARLQQLAAVVRYVGSHGGSEVAVVAFDQTREAIYRGAPGGFGDKHLAALRARAPLGGTDLGAALDHAGTVAASFGATSRVVLLSNGVATLGELDAGRLGARAAKLAEQGVVRLDTVCSTTARDVEALHAVATGGLPHAGVQLQLASGEQEPDLAALGRSTLAPIDVAVAGAGWVWPTRLEGLQDGDHALVYAEIPEAEPLRLTLSGGMVASLEPKTRSTIEPLLRRAWVRARIELLLSGAGATSDEQRATLRAEALRLSVKHRVLCELTALLVLETEFDYTRYHIDRKALADILTITHGGAAVLRSREQLAELLEDGRVANEVVEKVGARGNAEPGAPLAAPPAPAPTGGTVEKVTTGRPSRDDTREVNPEEQKKSVESIERKAIAGERVRGSAASRLFAAPDDDKDSIVEAKRYGEGEHELALRASAKASRLAAAPMASKKKLEHKLRLRLTLRPLTFRDAIDQSIDKVVTRKTPALRRCAENHVRAHGGGNLRAEFRITVGTAGTVTEVSTTNMPADLEECVAIKLRRIRGLPLLPSPRPATYEFLLSNDDAETAEETDGVTILPLGAKDADSDAIDGYAAGHAYGARWCYRALPAQERFRELEGRLQLTVDVDRKVTKATVTGLPQQLEQCVRKSLLHVDGFERASLVVAKAATREYRLVFNDPTAKRERPSPAQIAAWQRRHDEVTADRLARRIFAARVGVPDTHGHVAAFEQKLLQAANFDWDGVQTGCVAQALERKSGPLSLELRLVVDANENIRGWQLTSDDESLRTCAHAALAEPAFSVGADNERRKLDQDREKAALPPTVRSLRWTWARGKSPEAPTEPQPLAAEAIAGLVANFDVVREQHRLERERRSAVERREAELGLLRGAAVALTPAERKAARAEKEATLVGREGLQGQLRAVHDAIAAGRTADAVDLAWKSRHASATDVLALVALGDALLAQGDKVRA